MTPFNYFTILLLSTCLGIASIATQVADQAINPTIHITGNVTERSANTCADPSLARTVFQGFSGSLLAHILRFHWTLINIDTQQASGPAAWIFQGPAFKAWPSQQPFTAPLFQFTNPGNNDFIYMPGADAQTPPVVSGFSTSSDEIIAWVYNTSVCGSVPLMSVFFASKSDHYYTIDPEEHDALVAHGWTDSGVVGFVLPLPSL